MATEAKWKMYNGTKRIQVALYPLGGTQLTQLSGISRCSYRSFASFASFTLSVPCVYVQHELRELQESVRKGSLKQVSEIELVGDNLLR